MIRMARDRFEELVRHALEELPEEFATRIENVAVVVQDEPGPEELEELGIDGPEAEDELYGLYQGVPIIDRGTGYSGLPDRILIFMGPILRTCGSADEAAEEIRRTVIHELGHHLGLEDEEMPY